ncbi:hypothetical protein ACP4OV_005988 [Aristida adscensionis]
MEELRCVRVETQMELDPESKIIQPPVEEAHGGREEQRHKEECGGEEQQQHKVCGGGGYAEQQRHKEEERGGGKVEEHKEVECRGGSEEEQPQHKLCDGGRGDEADEEQNKEGGGGDAEDGEEEDERNDDIEELDEDDDLLEPSFWSFEPHPHCSAGAGYTRERANEIVEIALDRNDKLLGEWVDIYNNETTPLPVLPLGVLPEVTTFCVSESPPTHPYFSPYEMMQLFSLRLSGTLAHPIDIYGTFAIRDTLDPRRNYLFNHKRDSPATVSPGFSFLPLRSPCRGIYVLQYILIDVNLWIKEEGDGCADKLLFRGYCELNTSLSFYDEKITNRLQGEYHGLEMHYAFLSDSIETFIEVIATAEDPSSMKISATTSGYDDDEIALFDGAFCGTGVIVRHFIAVKRMEKLHVLLSLDDALYEWTFQAGVGILETPGKPIPGFDQYFVMNVSFRTTGKAASAWQWSCICNDITVAKICP